MLLTSMGVAGAVILLRCAGLLQAWEWAAMDQFFRLRPLEPVDQRLVIVGIDEIDLKQAKQWPISDAMMAQLIQKIQACGPRAIGLDVYRDFAVEPGHTELRSVYRSLPNLIGIHQIKDKANVGIPAPSDLSERGQVGFNNLVFDGDGRVRRGLLYWTLSDGRTYESFALKLALTYLKAEKITPQAAIVNPDYLQLGKGVFRPFDANDGGYVQADDGGYQIPGNLRGPAKTFVTVSMMDVLKGRIRPEMLRDRVVLIGSTADSLKDFFYTAYSNEMDASPRPTAGVELQANFVSQILSSALDGRSAINVWSKPWEWFWILIWSWLGAQIVWKLRSPFRITPIILLTGMGLAGICYGAFLVGGWWLPLVPPILGLTGAAIVITAHLAHLEEELKRSKEFLNSIINTIPDPIFVKDRKHRWIVLNQAYSKLLGYPLDDLLERSESDVFPAHEAEVFRQQDQHVFASAQESEIEQQFTNKAGITSYIATKRTLHKDAAGNLFLVGIIRDITDRKRMEEELKCTAAELIRSNAELTQSASHLRHLANHDALTGLPNRILFQERLNQALEWAKENNQSVALLFLDLDGFKLINDTQGHDVGDLLLKAIAQRLSRCLRGSDTVARLGGDEFTVILPAIPGIQDAGRVAEKILSTLSQPFVIEGKNILVTTSVGISLYPNQSSDAETLIKEADNAMYHAKESGKNCYQFASS
ncbi:MAG: CHASE2 domain-containing protein [Kovacikia sp.]